MANNIYIDIAFTILGFIFWFIGYRDLNNKIRIHNETKLVIALSVITNVILSNLQIMFGIFILLYVWVK